MGRRFICRQPRLCRGTGIYSPYHEADFWYDLGHVYEQSFNFSSDAIALYDDLDPTAAPLEIREMATQSILEKAGSMQSATSILKGLKVGIPQVCLMQITRMI